jgi:uncharacterized protein
VTRRIQQRPERLAVARLDPTHGWPWWATYSSVTSVTRTPTETSVVAEEHLVPVGVRAERGFVAFAVRGPLDFSEVGILASLTGALAALQVSCFAISTYDTDLILVRGTDAARAADAWRSAGWTVEATT